MEKRGHKVMFVCPTNKLAQKKEENGATLHAFLAIGMKDDLTQKMAKFDDSPYDVVVFDEIYFANIRMLVKIKQYADKNPNKIILATGDTKQLETIDLVSNQIDYDTYMNNCIDAIFPNNIKLHENKRLKTQEDKDTLRRFFVDIFNEKIPIIVTLKKYFKFVSEINTDENIAYRNSTCKNVSSIVRKRLNKTSDYEKGEVLVCRKYLKGKFGKCNVNCEYEVEGATSKSVVMKKMYCKEARSFEINLDLVKKCFIHGHCRTCHSYQGSTIEDKQITIFDWNYYFVDRKWIYTAVTRATELKNVFFYDGPVDKFDTYILHKYLDKKVANYKKQDLQNGIEITDNYITVDWLKKQMGKKCADCDDCMYFDIDNNAIDCNLTAERLDNSEGHHLNNIVPLCCSCNQKRSCWYANQ
jgi:ribosomal protein S24E